MFQNSNAKDLILNNKASLTQKIGRISFTLDISMKNFIISEYFIK